MRVVNERWNELENELGLGLPLNTLSEVDIANKWRLRALNAEKLLNKPQLTIPKSIAESNWMKHLILCSSITQFEFERYDFLDKEEEQFLKWVNTDKNENILYIYLASKALGVDLVKVVEND